LKWLTRLLGRGSVLLFDEFVGEEESEKRAFEDWSRESGVRTIQIAEFLRRPSGKGSEIDKRPLFQVVGQELLPKRGTPALRDRLLATPPGRLARRVWNLISERK